MFPLSDKHLGQTLKTLFDSSEFSTEILTNDDICVLHTLGAAIFPELEGAALVRELHVYGTLIPTKKVSRLVWSVGRLLVRLGG